MKEKRIKDITGPWFWIAISFIMGILLADIFNFSFGILYLSFFIVTFLCFSVFKHNKLFIVTLLLLFLITGALRLNLADFKSPNHISNFVTPKKEHVYLVGSIKDKPLQKEDFYGNRKTDFILNASYLIKDDIKIRTSGLIKVSVYGENRDKFRYGKSYLLEGKLYIPASPRQKEKFNYRAYLKQKGIYGLFYVSKHHGRVTLPYAKSSFLRRTAYRLKDDLNQRYNKLLSFSSSNLISAFLLGDREGIPESTFESFVHSGTVHILAISGLHIGIIVFILLFFFKLLGLKKNSSLITSVLFLIFYCFLTGARISVLRASIMTGIFVFGWALNRNSNVYNSLGLAGFILLVFNPYQLFEVGFQLSFVAVLSIVYLTPKLEKIICRRVKDSTLSIKSRIKNYVIKGTSASFCAWLGVLPITLYYFNISSTVTVFANLLILPILAAILAIGIAASVLSYLWFDLARVLSKVLEFILYIMLKVITFFGSFSFSYFEYKNVSMFKIVLYYVIILAGFNFIEIRKSLFGNKRLNLH